MKRLWTWILYQMGLIPHADYSSQKGEKTDKQLTENTKERLVAARAQRKKTRTTLVSGGTGSPTKSRTDDSGIDLTNPLHPLNPINPIYYSDPSPHHTPHHDPTPSYDPPSHDYGGSSSSDFSSSGGDFGSSDCDGGGDCGGGGSD